MIRVRLAGWRSLRRTLKLRTDDQLATCIGVKQPTITRAMNGDPVGGDFVAYTLTALPWASFDRLFVIGPR